MNRLRTEQHIQTDIDGDEILAVSKNDLVNIDLGLRDLEANGVLIILDT